MTGKLEHFLNSTTSIGLGLTLSRISPRFGYALARWLGLHIASLKRNAMVRAVRANQWVVHDELPNARELDRLVAATYQNTARSLYEFWHFFRNPDAILDLVQFEESFHAAFARARREDRGQILVVPHLSNFDLIGRAAVLHGYPLQILSYPQPPGGYRWQNKVREMPGMNITPMSVEALRQAAETLHAGGTVVTGVDRPLPNPDSKYRSRFFGRLASLPVFHIRLALKHELPISVVSGCRKPDGRYQVWASDPIPMQRSSDLIQETVQNAEAVLAELARNIRLAADQWAMFYPVWPESLEQMPA